MLGNGAFRSVFFAFGRLPLLAKAQIRQSRRQADPLIDEFSQATIVFQLLLHLMDLRITDRARRALPFPRKAELIVRTVLDGRGRFTSASRIAADVELLGYYAGSQIAQCRNPLFDLLDSLLKELGSAGHDVAIPGYRMREDVPLRVEIR